MFPNIKQVKEQIGDNHDAGPVSMLKERDKQQCQVGIRFESQNAQDEIKQGNFDKQNEREGVKQNISNQEYDVPEQRTKIR